MAACGSHTAGGAASVSTQFAGGVAASESEGDNGDAASAAGFDRLAVIQERGEMDDAASARVGEEWIERLHS